MSTVITTGVYYDGKFDLPVQDGAAVPWQDNDTRSTLYTVRFMQLVDKWKPAKFGLKGPNGSLLVEESTPDDKGGGIIAWERTYAEVPPSRVMAEKTTHAYQGQSETGSVVELTVGVVARVVYDYFNTTTPSKIKLPNAFVYTQVGSQIWLLGVPPKPGDKEILAENAQLSQWKGNIWERKLIYVPAFTPELIDS